MKKIDVGELVNNAYSNSEVIEYLNAELVEVTKNLISDTNKGSWAGIGAGVNQLGELSSILQKLNEKVNGKKEPVVV